MSAPDVSIYHRGTTFLEHPGRPTPYPSTTSKLASSTSTYQRSTNAAYILPLLRTTAFTIPFRLRAVRDHATAYDSGNDRLLFVRPLSVRCRVRDFVYR